MYLWATMAQFLPMDKRPLVKPTQWKVLWRTQTCKESFLGLSMIFSITSIVWRKILNFTLKCPILKSTWTKLGIFWILPRLTWLYTRTKTKVFMSKVQQKGLFQVQRKFWKSLRKENPTVTLLSLESLGGNAKTTVVICASPASFNEAE